MTRVGKRARQIEESESESGKAQRARMSAMSPLLEALIEKMQDESSTVVEASLSELSHLDLRRQPGSHPKMHHP